MLIVFHATGLMALILLIAVVLGLATYQWTNAHLLVDASKALLATKEAYYGGDGAAGGGSSRQNYKGITMAFRDVTYTVQGKEILKGVSGKLSSGKVRARTRREGSRRQALHLCKRDGHPTHIPSMFSRRDERGGRWWSDVYSCNTACHVMTWYGLPQLCMAAGGGRDGAIR